MWCLPDTGRTSGNLEIIDFDNGGELYEAWYDQIPAELVTRLVVERTPSGGSHVIYRCQSEVCGNTKLAARKSDGKIQTLIETRGEGGLFLCAPTSGYELIQGNLAQIPVLSSDERLMLLEAAWSLNTYIPEPAPMPTCSSAGSSLRPGDDYNARGDVEGLLQKHGWQYVGCDDINQHWRRPGKTWGNSASLRHKDKVFFVFSTNCEPFKHETPYWPFGVYAILEHKGDFSKAAADLAQQGYGEQRLSAQTNSRDISHLINPSQAVLEDDDDDEPVSLKKLIANFTGLNTPIIHGLLREGETMNIIASPKVGKSWLVHLFSISLASGLDWLNFKVEPGPVLLVDNELHQNTTTYRLMQVAKGLNINTDLFSDSIKVKSLRGKLQDMHRLSRTFNKIKPNEYKVIVIDAFYRTLPAGIDENDNGAIANLYNLLDLHVCRLNCAFILIHHASKGNQSFKSVTDVGAGAGSQSRAVDTHLVIRPHEEKDAFTVDAAVRSWAPIDAFVIRKQHPLFVVDKTADPACLQGAEKKRESKKPLTIEEFVSTCIKNHEPCSVRSIIYESEQVHNLSERKAKEMLELAIENKCVMKIKAGSKILYTVCRPEFSDDKGQWVAALISSNPLLSNAEIAHVTGVSDRYVRKIRSGTDPEQNRN